jgi:hypothetical protein
VEARAGIVLEAEAAVISRNDGEPGLPPPLLIPALPSRQRIR